MNQNQPWDANVGKAVKFCVYKSAAAAGCAWARPHRLAAFREEVKFSLEKRQYLLEYNE
jgi:hypothetical protein